MTDFLAQAQDMPYPQPVILNPHLPGGYALKPPSQFVNEIVDFSWPTLMIMFTTLGGWKAIRKIFDSFGAD